MINAQYITLCGGSGARLRPRSCIVFSKQFLCLTDKESLFQLYAQRLTKRGCNPRAMKEVQSDSYLGEVAIVRFEDNGELTKLQKSSGVTLHGCQ